MSCLLACSSSVNEPAQLHDATGAPVITILQLNGRQLTITASGGSVRYAARDASGRWLEELSLDQLASVDPALHEVARAALARAGGDLYDRLDGRLLWPADTLHPDRVRDRAHPDRMPSTDPFEVPGDPRNDLKPELRGR